MGSRLLFSIVRNGSRSLKDGFEFAQIKELADRRPDMKIKEGEHGSRIQKDILVIDPTGRASGVLLFVNGRLVAHKTDENTILWMLQIASDLGGRVIDSQIRTYKTPTERYFHPDDEAARRKLRATLRRARSRWIPYPGVLAKWVIVLLVVILALIGLWLERKFK